ncbi:MAG: hypothetical protein U0L61_03465, partial [Alistipes sp.]|nr:hypothetical protein [Alistipes sp.]
MMLDFVVVSVVFFRDNREKRDNRDNREKNNKKFDARLRSRPFRPSVRHCESRKARGNLILSA